MHNAFTATKTLSLNLEAYKKLKEAKRHPGESFIQVVRRATWTQESVTGAQLLGRCRNGAHFSEEDLNRIERLKRSDKPPEDKWAQR